MKKKAFFLVVLLAVAGAMASVVMAGSPLPKDLTIISPDTEPVWGGILRGIWDNKGEQETALVVEKMHPSREVVLVYSYGDYWERPSDRVLQGGFIRLLGKILPDGSILAEWESHRTRLEVSLVLIPQKDGSVLAEFRRKGGPTNRATLRRD